MNIRDSIFKFLAFETSTKASLEETKLALASTSESISTITAKLEAIEAASQVKAEDTADTTSDDSSAVDELISTIQKALDAYTASDESDDSTEDETSDDSTPDDSSDANDETAKASRTSKLKSLAKSVSKIVADSKALKASVPQQVIREIAAIGIPTAIATKPEGKPALTGTARAAAAFKEQFNSKK